MKNMRYLLIILTAFCFFGKSNAQELVPDTLFGANGLFRPSSPFTYPVFTLVENDGKMITIGSHNGRMVLQKTKTCGFIDSSFATFGRVFITHQATSVVISAGLISAEQKIILGGTCRQSGFSFDRAYMVRLKANGTIDSSFGILGSIVLPVISTSSGGRGIVGIRLLGDGKILCAGYAQDRFFSLRLKENGIVDSSFGTNGFNYLIPVIPNQAQYTEGTGLVLSDGRMMLQKTFYLSGNDLTACRAMINADGTFDTSPGTNGFVTSQDIKPVYSFRQAGDKIMALELVPGADSTVTYFRRWNSDLSPDLSFGNQGRLRIPGNGNAYYPVFNQGPDGKWYLFGDSTFNFSNRQAVLHRYLPDFTKDMSFGSGGRMRFRLSVATITSQKAGHLAFLPTGELVTFSTSGSPNNTNAFALLINCFTPNSNVPKISYNPPVLTSTGQGIFQWQLNQGDISGATTSVHQPSVSGQYRVRLTDSRNCRIFSASRNISFTSNQAPFNSGLEVFPNPVRNELKINFPSGRCDFTVTDATGKLVYSGIASSGGQVMVPVSGFPSGIYGLRFVRKDQVFFRKFLIE